MACFIRRLRPELIPFYPAHAPQTLFSAPRGIICQSLRKHSVQASAYHPSEDAVFWTAAKGAPPGMKKEDAAAALTFAYTNEKPYRWGNLLPFFWLRDNCRCSVCINQYTRQRNFNTFELPVDITPTQVITTETGLGVQWSHGSHASFYTWDFLEPYIKGHKPKPDDVPIECFGAEGHPSATIEYGEFEENETQTVGRWADMIKRKGFAFVTGVPTDSANSTKNLLEKIAFIRKTHYGGFYDFTPDLAHADTAYTNQALAAHTDTTYFSDTVGLQAFHLLSHTGPGSPGGSETGLGGQSLLVDGYHAAQILKREAPDLFEILASVGVPFHASGNEGITIAPDKLYPVLELDAAASGVRRIRWNNDDRGVLPLGGTFSAARWYAAGRKWDEILRRKDLEYWFQLKPGTVIIFDNWRVLHGRSAFTGVRRICGGYINRDDFISRWRNTNYPRDQVLKQVIG